MDVIRSILDKERPDLIVVTGDLVDGDAWDGESAEWWGRGFERFETALGGDMGNGKWPFVITAGPADLSTYTTDQFRMIGYHPQNHMNLTRKNEYKYDDKPLVHQFT